LLQPIDPNTNAAATKLATNFNTNRTYINEAARLKQGREKKKEEGKLYGRGNTKDEKVLSIIDRTFEEETHNTQKIIAEEIGKSTAPTLATIGRMPGRLRNLEEIRICQKGIIEKPYQKLD